MKFSGLIVFFYLLISILVGLGWLAPDFNQMNPDQSYLAPSTDYLLGTDFMGRSVLQRSLKGAQIAMMIGLSSAFCATLLGLLLGMISGYFQGWLDALITWLFNTIESIPYILLIAGLSYTLGAGLLNLFLALSLTAWVGTCRLIRTEVIKQRTLDYVSASQAMGASDLRNLFVHIMPNILPIAIVQFNLLFIYSIKVEVILSFLGLGVEPGTPSWGLMINDAKDELTRGVWWGLASASSMMFILIFSIHYLSQKLGQDKRNYQPTQLTSAS
jgi:ABC-type dipeptide/oligopeptide/nickel transport system permease subunit